MHHHCRDWAHRWPEISILISVHIFIRFFLLLLNIKICISLNNNELYFRQFVFDFIKSNIFISPLSGLVMIQFQEDRHVSWFFFYVWHLHKLTLQLPLSYGILISVCIWLMRNYDKISFIFCPWLLWRSLWNQLYKPIVPFESIVCLLKTASAIKYWCNAPYDHAMIPDNLQWKFVPATLYLIIEGQLPMTNAHLT